MKDEKIDTRYWNAKQCTISVGKVTILPQYCKGGEDCDDCIRFCPEKVLERGTETNERGFFPPVFIEDGRCTVCGRCQLYCAENAIFVQKVGERMVCAEDISRREEHSE